MEGQEYLNQIAAENRPATKQKKGILSSKFFLVGAIGVAALILIIIIGVILGGNKGDEKNLSFALKVHLDNVSGVISEYQTYVKSSDLRSDSASLYAVLSDTSHNLTDYISSKYNVKEKEISKNASSKSQKDLEELKNSLFEAKINGILDRVYAHKMAYEISLFMTEESKISNSTRSDSLKEIVGTSYSSLEKLYDVFNNFSEAK